MKSLWKGAAGVVGCVFVAGACSSDTSGPADGDQVAVSFAAVAPASAQASVSAESLELSGSNGVLRIEEMHLIVAEFDLKRIDDDFCDDDLDDGDCEKFEAPPAFLDVPLDGSGVLAVQQDVPAGTYDEFEFEVEDLDDDEDDATQAQQIDALRTRILAQFPDWPRDASMLVTGTFTPAGGDAIPFRVYFEAEIEIEMDLAPPLVVDGTSDAPAFTVQIDPDALFGNDDGTVRNLSTLDFDTTGQVVEFEVEIENGIREIEFDD